jgi:hypothetical protein
VVTVLAMPTTIEPAVDVGARAMLQRAPGLWQKCPETVRGFHAMLGCARGGHEVRGRDLTSGLLLESGEVEEVHCQIESVWLPRAYRAMSLREGIASETCLELGRHVVL